MKTLDELAEAYVSQMAGSGHERIDRKHAYRAGFLACRELAGSTGCCGKDRVCCYDCWQLLRTLGDSGREGER